MANFPSRPLPSEEELKRFFVGKDVGDVPKPSIILDVNIIKKHCTTMLQTTKSLEVGFRAHVKTHKVCAGISDFPQNPEMVG